MKLFAESLVRQPQQRVLLLSSLHSSSLPLVLLLMRPTKSELKASRKRRIRARVSGTSDRPRLTVFVSLTRLTAQLVDDVTGNTLAFAVSKKGKNIAAATKLGDDIAAQAKAKKITSVVFDRNGRKYHGRIKALADAARKSGLVL